MNRRKRRKRINYYGHHYFEGDAVRALAPAPQEYAFADLDEISVVGDQVAKWNAAKDRFSWRILCDANWPFSLRPTRA